MCAVAVSEAAALLNDIMRVLPPNTHTENTIHSAWYHFDTLSCDPIEAISSPVFQEMAHK